MTDQSSALVLGDTADVQNGEADLEDDQRPGVIVPAPADPEGVADEENPEPPLGFLFDRAAISQADPRLQDGEPRE
jgi:hypothetical protein